MYIAYTFMPYIKQRPETRAAESERFLQTENSYSCTRAVPDIRVRHGWARVTRVVAIAMIFVLLSVGGAQADWMQAGHDASRTGAVNGDGPQYNETALIAELPGYRPHTATPLILDDVVYALTTDAEVAGKQVDGIAAVDLATGTAQIIHELDTGPFGFASDGDALFAIDRTGIAAYPLQPGDPIWTLAHPDLGFEPAQMECVDPAVQAGSIYFGCRVTPATNEDTFPYPATGEVPLYVARVDADRGTYDWVWTKGAAGSLADPTGFNPATTSTSTYLHGLAVGEHQVIVITTEDVGTAGAVQSYAWALSIDDGTLSWPVDSREGSTEQTAQHAGATDSGNMTSSLTWNYATPTIVDGIAFLKFHELAWVDEQSGDLIAKHDIRSADVERHDWAAGMAYDDGILHAATSATITAIEVKTKSLAWAVQPLVGSEEWHADGLFLTDDRMYARAAAIIIPTSADLSAPDAEYRHDAIYAFDRSADRSPKLAWRHVLPNPLADVYDEEGGPFYDATHTTPAHAMAVANGVIALHAIDGKIIVLGRTAASIQLDVEADDVYPALGEEVTLDVSGTQPGTQAPDIEYRIDWGDGQTSAWTEQTLFTHRYGEVRDIAVRIEARNAAGQTSVEEVVFQVGKEDPREPTLLEKAFDPDNQDKTFFVLGLMVTLGGAIIGVSRIHARRSLLARELEAVEDAFLMTRHIPLECEQALGERKTHARALLLDNKLHESQFGVLDRRIDELRGDVRVNSLEDRFDFMPVGLMKTLQRILADGHITTGEHENFLTALDANKMMTETQKDKVKKLIDRWFVRDAVAPWADTAN